MTPTPLRSFVLPFLLGFVLFAGAVPIEAHAQSFSMLSRHSGALAFAICAGFCLRHVGLVRRQSAFAADIECIVVFIVSCAAFLLVGWNLLLSVGGDGALVRGVIGSLSVPHLTPVMSHVIVLTTASAAIAIQIVSGALAERIRLGPLAIFALIFAGAVYPIIVSWQFAGGWLAKAGFIDYGGATFIHVAGAAAALAGIIVLGARIGRFDPSYRLEDKEHHSYLLAGLGTLLVIIGWQGLIGGLFGTLPVGPSERGLVHILRALNCSAASAGAVALMVALVVHRSRAIPITLNGIVAGLVAISADPAHPSIAIALLVGVGAGLLAALVPLALERARLDDVTGAVPAHLCAGIWGTLTVALSAPGANLGTQAIGALAVGVVAFAVSLVIFLVLQIAFGLRSSRERQDAANPPKSAARAA
jgi:ammonium transporter, Amt family